MTWTTRAAQAPPKHANMLAIASNSGVFGKEGTAEGAACETTEAAGARKPRSAIRV